MVCKDHWLLGGGQLGEGESIWEAVSVVQRGRNSVWGLGGGRGDGEKQRGLGVERMALLMGRLGALRQRQQSRMTSQESGRGIVG